MNGTTSALARTAEVDLYAFSCRSPIFGSQYSDQDVLQSLLGNTPLPWEMDSGFFEMIPNIDARNLVKNLLR